MPHGLKHFQLSITVMFYRFLNSFFYDFFTLKSELESLEVKFQVDGLLFSKVTGLKGTR